MATNFNKILSCYQPRQVVEWRVNRRFKNLTTRTETVLEAFVYSSFNQLTRLLAQEYVTDIFCCRKCVS